MSPYSAKIYLNGISRPACEFDIRGGPRETFNPRWFDSGSIPCLLGSLVQMRKTLVKFLALGPNFIATPAISWPKQSALRTTLNHRFVPFLALNIAIANFCGDLKLQVFFIFLLPRHVRASWGTSVSIIFKSWLRCEWNEKLVLRLSQEVLLIGDSS